MRLLLAAVVLLAGLGVLAGLLVVFVFNFLTLSPGRHYGPGLYAGMALILLAMLVVIGVGYVLLRRILA
jgi:hypothetical protein